jgi:hypothetical protein
MFGQHMIAISGESPLALLRSFSATAFAIFSPSAHQAYRLAEPKLAERRLVELSGLSTTATQAI